ncbi:flavodoxin family protein [Eubacterium oxidoreducens]|uniref:Multimeric flavodoxin WrbA n=1 Tax=Eubacterium oxidoreducens TaxID=1732 RepID=A0A1G6C0U9_EUBOX|nr:flavodoxin family protein [Eubacterium oxidoreducens]SDB26447.1 Multimeric flavodoxin WrbA [Eubacterium oxidoreducens]
MKKIVIYNGSPRKDGNTTTILDMIARGAREHGAEVEYKILFKMKFMACQGCFNCRIHENCAINDELTATLNKLKDADAVVIGSPVYFMQMTGPVKNLYDRLFPLMGEDGTPRYSQKQIATVYTQEFDDPHMFDDYFNYVAGTFPSFGFVNERRLVCTGGNNPESAEKNQEIMQKAYELGRILAQ